MTRTTRAMTKSPVLIARSALMAGKQALSDYSSPYSKKRFTQAQLFAILVLKTFFRTDYRGIVALIKDFKDLRDVLELKKIPHFSTLAYAEKRLLKKGLLTYSSELSSNMQAEPDFLEVKRPRSLTPPD